MSDNSITVTIEQIRAGQPHAYSASYYEARLRFSRILNGKPFGITPSKELVIALTKLFVRDFDDDDTRYGLNPYLDAIEQEEKDCWRVLVVQPYDD